MTETEQKIRDLVLKGHANHQIAIELNLSLNTVKHHLTSIYRQENVKSRYELTDKYR